MTTGMYSFSITDKQKIILYNIMNRWYYKYHGLKRYDIEVFLSMSRAHMHSDSEYEILAGLLYVCLFCHDIVRCTYTYYILHNYYINIL